MTPETQHVEWKRSWRDEHLKWICGFANAQGGILEIGKDDSGKVVGVKGVLRLLEEIPGKAQPLLGIVVDVNLKSERGTLPPILPGRAAPLPRRLPRRLPRSRPELPGTPPRPDRGLPPGRARAHAGGARRAGRPISGRRQVPPAKAEGGRNHSSCRLGQGGTLGGARVSVGGRPTPCLGTSPLCSSYHSYSRRHPTLVRPPPKLAPGDARRRAPPPAHPGTPPPHVHHEWWSRSCRRGLRPRPGSGLPGRRHPTTAARASADRP